MRKKGYWVLLAILLSVCMLFAFAGCDPNGSGEESGGNGNNSSVVDPNGDSENDDGNGEEKPDDGQGGNGEQKPDDGQGGNEEQKPDDGQGGNEEQKPDDGQGGNEEQKPDDGQGGNGEQKPDDGNGGNGEQKPDDGQGGNEEQKPDDGQGGNGEQKPDDGNGGNGEQKPEEHKHSYTADNVCSTCGKKWEYTEGLEYTLDEETNTFSVTGIGTADGDVVLPYGYRGKYVTSIGERAFYDCSGLTSIEIPESVTSIGSGAFSGTAYYNDESNWEGGVLYIGNHLIDAKQTVSGAYTIKEGTKTIADWAFSGCSGLTSIEIPDSVTSIGAYAFKDCSELESIVIPDSVTSIGDQAFRSCIRLTSVTIGKSVTSIGRYAFYECDGLTSVTIPDSVTSIGDQAFKDCSGLTSVHITDLAAWCKIHFGTNSANPLDHANHLYLNGEEVTELTIPEEITEIKAYAFYGCHGLTSVTIGSGVTSIGREAFDDCYKLVEVWNHSKLNITKGSSDNGYVAYYAKNVYKTSGENKRTVTEDGYIFYEGETSSYLLGYQGKETALTLPEKSPKENNYEIYQYAFENCSNLTSVTIGNSVTSIGEFAFYECDGLTSVTIPDSVTGIGQYAFYDCDGLTSVTIGSSVTSIGEKAFCDCDGLTSVTIGSGVTSIGEKAFDECYKLVEVWNHSNLEITKGSSDNGYVAYYAKNVYKTSGESKRTVTEDGYIFYEDEEGSYLLGYQGTETALTLPEKSPKGKNYEIYRYAFYYCRNLTSVTIGNGVTSIGKYAFWSCRGLTSIVIPDGVTSIGDYAFNGCSNLTSVTIPDSVNSIGFCAFWGCSSLTSVTIGNGVISIGSSAFKGCSGLESIVIPDGVTEIGNHAFEDCSNLTSVQWNAVNCTVTVSGYPIFAGCTKLSTVTFGESVQTIPAYAFSDCSRLRSIVIPASVTSIGEKAFSGCSKLESITVEKGNQNYSSQDGILYNKEKTEFIDIPKAIKGAVTIPDSVTSIGGSAFSGCSGLTSVTIGNGVTSIGKKAFYDCDGLTSVTIGSGVTSIGDYAFEGCSGLTSVTIGNSVTSIGYEAFYHCSGLESVTIGNNVTSIGWGAFSGCSGLKEVHITDLAAWCKIDFGSDYANPLYYAHHLYLNGEEVTELTIPEEITEIKAYAFYDCDGLTSVTIGNGVTSIGEEAFYDCDGLKEVHITDLAAWCKIDFGNSFANPLRCANHLYLNGKEVTELTIPEEITEIKAYAFYDCDGLTSITIPDSVTSIGKKAFYDCDGLTSITVAAGNTVYKSEKNCLIEKDTNTLILGCKNSEIPESVTSIGAYAFAWCSGLTSITIPDSVTSIENGAFDGCSWLTSVTFENPDGWQVSTKSDMSNATSLDSSDLSDPATAAKYLRSTYYNYYWKKN